MTFLRDDMNIAGKATTGEGYNKLAYDNEATAIGYEQRSYYRGQLGRFRKFRERAAVHSAVQQFSRNSTVLDCPCGNGRWFERLARRAQRIVAIDTAPTMVDAARKRTISGVALDVRIGDAEALDLPDAAVEHVFCYALMKHVPRAVQRRILGELARVSTNRIAVSFAVLQPLAYLQWIAQGSHGHPVWSWEIAAMAGDVGLSVGAIYPVGLPLIGMEALVVLERGDREPGIRGSVEDRATSSAFPGARDG